MSWWDTPRGTVLGDGPADIVQKTLQESAGRRKPPLPELLSSIAAALKLSGKLAARSKGVPDVRESGPADGELTKAFRNAFEKIAEEYRAALRREPTTEELLETIQFILGWQPERYLEGAEGMDIYEIRVE